MGELTDTMRRFKIFIVEDSSPFREMLKEVLHDRFPSVEIYEAIDGEEALKQFETLNPDLVFMDIRLPGENGLQVTRRIKSLYPKITVIVLTSYDCEEYREAAIRFGGDYYIPKDSLSSVHLEKVVKSFIE